MRMIKTPRGLKITKFEEVKGPELIGQTISLNGFVQTVVNPFGFWTFRLSFAPMRGPMARAFEKWRTGFLAGGNCSRFQFFDPHELEFTELGLPDQKVVRASNGKACSNGRPFSLAPPVVPIVADAPKGNDVITIDVTRWKGRLPAWLGIVGFYGVYKVITEQVHNNIATLRIWPPLRHKITSRDLATMRPVVCVTVASGQGATGFSQGHFYQSAGLVVREVLQETVDRFVIED